MNCRDLESQLTPYLDGELIAEARAGVEGHLSVCPTCTARLDRERHALLLVRDALQASAPKAPEQLRARISASLREDVRARAHARARRLTAVAATVGVVLAAGHQGYRAHQRRLYEQDAALRHARQFPLEIQATERSPQALEQWFGGKLDHRVSVPQFPNARATGARLLQVRDKPAAYIRYDAPAQLTGPARLSALRAGQARTAEYPLAPATKQLGLFVYGDDHDVPVGSEPAVANSHGYNVVSWREGDVVYQLVTDLDEQDVRELLPASSLEPSDGLPAGSSTPSLDLRPASLGP